MKYAGLVFLWFILFAACSGNRKSSSSNSLPPCLDSLVKNLSGQQPDGSPESITRYRYNSQTVYYAVARCCDQYNTVYDEQCNVLGHPDGGITGRGDGMLPDFFTKATDKKLIWEKKTANQ